MRNIISFGMCFRSKIFKNVLRTAALLLQTLFPWSDNVRVEHSPGMLEFGWFNPRLHQTIGFKIWGFAGLLRIRHIRILIGQHRVRIMVWAGASQQKVAWFCVRLLNSLLSDCWDFWVTVGHSLSLTFSLTLACTFPDSPTHTLTHPLTQMFPSVS